MAVIVIKDLPESSELDREAMRAITGGSRFRAAGAAIRQPVRRIQLFDLSRKATPFAKPSRAT
ncbi:hypothetical protein AB4Z19_07620 [Pseudoduganella sp. RAF19]|uniref:hypothetical protein n=1 Tax=Pseudoduganella sp. RAF19 TaxID=3233052 RepID=UPI003F99CEBA